MKQKRPLNLIYNLQFQLLLGAVVMLLVAGSLFWVLYETNTNLLRERRALCDELDRLKTQNAEMSDKIFDLNQKVLKMHAPTEAYELLRRRILSNTRELRNHVGSVLRNASAGFNDNRNIDYNAFFATKNTVGEHLRSLLSDVAGLERVDGHSSWRHRESDSLSYLVQKRLRELQNPPDCDEARKFVCHVSSTCEFGCRLHHLVSCLVFAYVTNRTMIISSTDSWNFPGGRWDKTFMPLSNGCFSTNGKSVSPCPGNTTAQVLFANPMTFVNAKVLYLPLGIPADLATRLNVIHGDPVVWWVGQFLKYILVPQPSARIVLDEFENRVNFRSPIVGVHVGRNGKISNASYNELDKCMYHVEEYYGTVAVNGKVVTKRIFLATDDSSVFEEAKTKYPEYEIIGGPNIPKSAMPNNPESEESLMNTISDIHLLSRCDYLVCTLSSNVCRIAYELMNSLHPDGSAWATSVDEMYSYAHQNRRIAIAVLRHKTHLDNNESSGEIDLEPGDEILVSGNRWDGYSEGTNLRTMDNGHYPTFKVAPKIETLDDTDYPFDTICEIFPYQKYYN